MGHIIRRPVPWRCSKCGGCGTIENPDMEYLADSVWDDHQEQRPRCRPTDHSLTFLLGQRVFEVQRDR